MAETTYLARDDVIDEARDFVRQVGEAEDENRHNGEADLLFKAGEQWPAEVKQAREAGDNPRPCLTINEIPAFLAQVTNDYRQNRPGVQVHPVDNVADPDIAQIIAGLGRHITYASQGDAACDNALQSAVDIGWGYYRLYTDYVSEDSFDQEIKFGLLPNAFSVYFDAHSFQPDGSDAKQCVITERMTRKDFERLYPTAEACNTSLIGSPELSEEWLSLDHVQVAEYYRTEYAPDTLLLLSNGVTGWQSQLPAGLAAQLGVVQSRAVQRKVIKWYKCTGVDALDEKVIPGKWIPVIPVYGNTILVKGRKYRFGLIRFLRDPQTMLNYWETTKTELLALQPRAPWVGPAGFMDGYEQDWRQANLSNVVALEYNYVDPINGTPLPPPNRMAFPPPPAGVIEAAASAQQYMQVVTGIHQPVRLTAGSQRSGESIRQEDAQGDMASYHYFANAGVSLLHAWRIMLAWIPCYYDTPRVVRIVGEDGTATPTPINQPGLDRQGIARVLNDVTVGEYDVVLSTGPNYQTRREEAVANMVDLARQWPKLLEVAGSDLVKQMDWPGAEAIAKKVALGEPQPPPEQGAPEAQAQQLMLLLQQKSQEAQALNAHAMQVEQQCQQQRQEAQALNAHAFQVEQQVQRLAQENQHLKDAASLKAGDLQVKQGELAIREHELRLREQELAMKANDTRMKFELELARIGAEHERARASLEQERLEAEEPSEEPSIA